MEMTTATAPVEVAPVLTLTEEDIEKYLADKMADGLKPTAAAKYRSHLQHLCKWLNGDKPLTKELLLQWRAELETFGYSNFTVERYVTDVNLYTKYRGRPDLNIKKTVAYDLKGKTFGYLTVLEMTGKKSRKDNIWLCRCKCGKEIEVAAGLLARGNTTSCGCLNLDILKHANRYEEGTELRQAMTEKILNPNSASGYVGVVPHRDKWSAHITYKGKHYYLGTFSKIEDAIKARARAKEAVMEDAARIYEETQHLYTEKPGRPPRPKKEVKPAPSAKYPARRNDNTSGYPGIVRADNKWAVNIGVNGFRYNLGRYENLDEAIAIRKQAESYALSNDIEKLTAMSRSVTKY